MTTRGKKSSGIPTNEALELINSAANDSVTALVAAREAAGKAAASDKGAAKSATIVLEQIEKSRPAPVDPRDGIGRGLLSVEQSTWARLSPRHRNRWPKLAGLDGRVDELDQRQATLVREIETLQQQRSSAEQRHADKLAGWFQDGQRGERPASDALQLDERLADARAEHDALDAMRGIVLQEKIAYVQSNRKSLSRTAASAVQKARADYETQIDRLEQARDALIDARATALWTMAFPHESLTAAPPVHALAGGVKSVNQRWLPGLTSDIQAAALLGLLRDDAQYIATMITADLKAASLGVRPEMIRSDVAVWGGSEEDLARQKREKERELEQQTIAFGRRPARYSG